MPDKKLYWIISNQKTFGDFASFMASVRKILILHPLNFDAFHCLIKVFNSNNLVNLH